MRSADASTSRLRTSLVAAAILAACGVVLAVFAVQDGRTLSLAIACLQVAAAVWILVDNTRELRRRGAARDR
ncbi:hypothetical protein [Cellulomonas sp. Y8]|uniref:hypothetical protein n=1 Tax=Cellulomonas sp. Y8 TaxID=2591145 RepID=UPI003D70DE23